MRLEVYCRDEVERGVVIHGAYALISIRDPDKPRVRFNRSSGLRAVLELAFHDSEPTGGVKLPAEIVLFDDEQARMICEFITALRSEVDVVVVHCEQGMSRSPAVAAGVATILGESTDVFFSDYQPNRFVYDVLVEFWQDRQGKPIR